VDGKKRGHAGQCSSGATLHWRLACLPGCSMCRCVGPLFLSRPPADTRRRRHPSVAPLRLHSCSDYHVMDVCANCGLLISTVNIPQAASGGGHDRPGRAAKNGVCTTGSN
jgi:hypothetical protein